MKISVLTRLLDLISPRTCIVCGKRLTVSDTAICSACNLHLPRTGYQADAEENAMAKLFWGSIKLERAAALFYYEPHAETSRIIHAMKYGNRPDAAIAMGRMAAMEYLPAGFFEGIDAIIPVPLSRKRERQRGYNQSEQIARGIAAATGIALETAVVRRKKFKSSQTRLNRWERQENVENQFEATDAERLANRHVLLVDDITTTGATLTACAKAMAGIKGLRCSIMTLGFAKS